MTRKITTFISMVLATILAGTALFTTTTTILKASAAGDKTIKYVSVGDSMTTGYGIDLDKPLVNNGYLCQQEKAYPVLVKNYLQEKYPDHTVELTQLAVNGIRTNELRYALEHGQKNAYPGDKMINDYLNYDDEEVFELYQKSFKEADYISIALGNNDFLQTFLSQTLNALNNMGNAVNDVYRPKFNPYLEYLFYENNEFRKVLAETSYTQIRAVMVAALNALGGKTLTSTYLPLVEEITGYFIYTFVGYLQNYEAIMDQVVKINNDATIMLVGMANVLRGVYLTFSLGNLELKIDVGDIFSIMSDGFNSYAENLAKTYSLKSSLSFRKTYKVYYVEAKDVTVIGKGFSQGIDDRRRPTLIKEMSKNFVNAIKRNFADIFDELDELDLATVLSSVGKNDAREYYNKYVEFLAGNWLPESKEDNSEMLTIATYMAFEEALVQVTKKDKIDGMGLVAVLNGSSSIFDTKGADSLLKKNELREIFSLENIHKAIEERDFNKYITQPIFELIEQDSVLQSYLFIIGAMYYDGTKGIHPDENGHEQYAKAMIRAIEARSPLSYEMENTFNTAVNTVKNTVHTVTHTVTSTINIVFAGIRSFFGFLFRIA